MEMVGRILSDSLVIAKIYNLLQKSKECPECCFEPDVRFKVEFVFDDESYFLCFSDPKDFMSYAGKLYKYNETLCALIINIIEKTGVKMPKIIGPPKPKSNRSGD